MDRILPILCPHCGKIIEIDSDNMSAVIFNAQNSDQKYEDLSILGYEFAVSGGEINE